jgi:hypothetical protein
MFAIRNLTLSVHKKISDLFTAPPNNPDTSTPYITAYNVYGEDEYQNDDFSPTRPFIFLLMARVPPKKTRLPCVIMELSDFPNEPYEVGTRRGALGFINLHIFGKNRGERDDLAGYIRLALTDYAGLTIYDWSTISNPVTKYVVSTEDIAVQQQTIAPDLATEGSLTNWCVVSFSLFTKE